MRAGVGGLYGGGGRGGTWALFDGKAGADGGAGVIILGYRRGDGFHH